MGYIIHLPSQTVYLHFPWWLGNAESKAARKVMFPSSILFCLLNGYQLVGCFRKNFWGKSEISGTKDFEHMCVLGSWYPYCKRCSNDIRPVYKRHWKLCWWWAKFKPSWIFSRSFQSHVWNFRSAKPSEDSWRWPQEFTYVQLSGTVSRKCTCVVYIVQLEFSA